MELLLNDEVGQQKLLEELSQGGGGGGGGSGGGRFTVEVTRETTETMLTPVDPTITFDDIVNAWEAGQPVDIKVTNAAGFEYEFSVGLTCADLYEGAVSMLTGLYFQGALTYWSLYDYDGDILADFSVIFGE